MTTWVALLRGVNVNGITIRSADLAALLRRLGFDDVKTVLASGNARFSTDVDVTGRAELKARGGLYARLAALQFGLEAA